MTMKTCLIGGSAAAPAVPGPSNASSAAQPAVQPHLRTRAGLVTWLDPVSLEQLLPDHHALDLGRALADQEQRRVAVEPLDLVLLRVAVPAVDPEGVLDDLLADLGGEQLRHARLEVGPLARVLQAAARRVSRRAASTFVAMSASLNWIAWCCAIGLPKVRRSCE